MRPPPTVPVSGNKEEFGESSYEWYANFESRVAGERNPARGYRLCGK
jgi:hypothetical protein